MEDAVVRHPVHEDDRRPSPRTSCPSSPPSTGTVPREIAPAGDAGSANAHGGWGAAGVWSSAASSVTAFKAIGSGSGFSGLERP